ncbi:MAG TPA: hypothetical protein VNZ52_04145 [Candidatus Thermoplasmatota archaeon]|nr:hypothetical protein [Candidatus Thermoplasmatota archaeon]
MASAVAVPKPLSLDEARLAEARARARACRARRARWVRALVPVLAVAIGLAVWATVTGDDTHALYAYAGMGVAVVLAFFTGRAHGRALRAVREARRLRRSLGAPARR